MESRLTTPFGDGATDTPATFARERIGPYRILSTLGRGATGVVFRGEHEETGAPAAIKTLSVADPSEMAGLRREIHALSCLGDPGVVEVREQGVEGSMPWYAMELIEGGTIESLWPSPPSQGDAAPRFDQLRPALRSFGQLCRTLAFLHGEGIVHRDLKPANILLRPNGEPVLVDFGFVARFGGGVSREMLEVGGAILGSLPYMAPEQARGEFVDARADLYSLGCILYQAATGRPPFLGTAWEVLEQQLGASPDPPSRHAPDISPVLEQIILRLLAKNPHERIGYAVDVATQMRSLAPEADVEERRPARMYLYRPTFAGRARHVQQLDACLQRLKGGVGGLVFVAGESGVGKTRLAMEATRRATADGLVVVTGQCVSIDSALNLSETKGGPLHPLIPLLRLIADYCQERGREVADRIVGRRGKVLGAYEPTLATLPGQEEQPEPVPLPGLAARERLIGDLTETLSLFAREMRLIVVIDDLQWADELTLHTLSAPPPQFYEQAPLLVVGCYRSEEISPELEALARSPHSSRIQLGRLDTPTVASIVSDMLAIRRVPEPLIRFLATQSEGNPFFVSEYLRMVVGEQLLVRSKESEWTVVAPSDDRERGYDSLPLPHTVRDLVARRLEKVPAAARRLADAAAVLGREFELALAATVADLGDTAQMEAATHLLASQIVEELSGERFRFTHDKLREVAVARLPSEQLRDLHRRAALAIEQRYADTADLPQWYGGLAVHWAGAKEDLRAARYFALAGETALRAGASGEARTMLTRALALEGVCTPRQPALVRSRWLRMLGEAAMGTGDVGGVIVHANEALVELGESIPTSQIGWAARLLKECAVLMTRPRGEPSRASDETDETARCAAQLTAAHYLRSDVLPGLATSLRCINLANASGAPDTAMQSYAHLGYVAGAARLSLVARRCFERVRALRNVADASVFAGSLYFEAMYETGLGHWERSRELAEESVRILEGVRDRQEAEIANTIAANALFYQGHFSEAEQRCRTMLESARARGNAQHSAWGLMLSGRSLLYLGRLDEALASLEQGRSLLEPLDDLVSKIMCEGMLARAYVYAGNQARAREVSGSLAQLVDSRWVVPLAQCLDGISALPEVSMRLHSLSGEPSLSAVAHQCRILRRFSRLFPLARPAALRETASLLWAHRSRHLARWVWHRSLRAAARLRMPYEEARTHQVLAAHAGGESLCREHRRLAERLFTELGCDYHLAELRGR